MPDMYDKLGEMLNEVLESGEIPRARNCEAENPGDSIENQNDQNFLRFLEVHSGHYLFVVVEFRLILTLH